MDNRAVLSCLECRVRKVKCDRTLPVCDKCSTSSKICSYPARRPRAKKSPGPEPRASKKDTQETLALIWDRLRRIEERTEKRDSAQTPDRVSGAGLDSNGDSSSISSPWREAEAAAASTAGIQTPGFSPRPGFGLDSRWHRLNVANLWEPPDILSSIGGAVEEVLAQRTRETIASSKEFISRKLHVSPVTARRWVNNYFAEHGPRFFPAITDKALIDIKLLCLMPDLVDTDHVHVDACILVIYYSILWQGHFEYDEETKVLKKIDLNIDKNIYMSCLRAVAMWQRQAKGTVTDFVAALCMATVAAENLDFDLSWELHRQACNWSQSLHLHILDAVEDLSPSPVATSDGGRMCMWNLVQAELLHRLVNDKPPAFSFNLSQWRVNLPFLTFDEPMGDKQTVPATAFLARSRLTLILINFFQMSESSATSHSFLDSVLRTCEEVDELVQEWKIFEWAINYKQDSIDAWYIAELALSCYSCIFFMLRTGQQLWGDQDDRWHLVDDCTPQSRMALRATRKILLIVYHTTHVMKLPGPESLSLAIGTYGAHVAYEYLARYSLQNPQSGTAEEDMTLLKRFESSVREASLAVGEYLPLVAALRSANVRIEATRRGQSH